MKVFDCKCEECKAEFQAVLENPEEKIECPSCNKDNVTKTEIELEAGCGGGCGGCSGSCH